MSFPGPVPRLFYFFWSNRIESSWKLVCVCVYMLGLALIPHNHLRFHLFSFSFSPPLPHLLLSSGLVSVNRFRMDRVPKSRIKKEEEFEMRASQSRHDDLTYIFVRCCCLNEWMCGTSIVRKNRWHFENLCKLVELLRACVYIYLYVSMRVTAAACYCRQALMIILNFASTLGWLTGWMAGWIRCHHHCKSIR